MKILLIQTRKDKMIEHEYNCFLREMNLKPEELVSYDMFLENKIDSKIVDQYDAVILGGTGEFAVYNQEKLPFLEDVYKLIRYCYQKNIPLLGVCFGIQLAAIAFDGEVKYMPEKKEAGNYLVTLSEEGKRDLIFENMPEKFYAVIGHMDFVTKVPESAIVLASSERCPVQAITFPGKKFYVFQFHPELDKCGLIDRLKFYYKKGYAKEEEIQDIIDNAPEADEPRKILMNFKNML